jgi:hypothetical protein
MNAIEAAWSGRHAFWLQPKGFSETAGINPRVGPYAGRPIVRLRPETASHMGRRQVAVNPRRRGPM